jgi:pimeloyl-ACP methyl ester carboxylesterase
MSREIIHFAHANSFPAGSYRKLFAFLEDDFQINYLERHAHDPRFPVRDGWRELAHELHEDLKNRYTEPIIGIGHSMGGILHFLLAVEQPQLYKAIILLDSPLIGKTRAQAIRLTKRFGVFQRLMPSSRTAQNRRRHWNSKEEAFAHFKHRKRFPHFDEECLRDYVEHGTVEHEQGVKLYFDPETEAQIYRTLPDYFHRLTGKLTIPAAYIGGTHSREARLAGLRFMRRHFPFRFYFLEGTHLFPLEKPDETAQAIRHALVEIKVLV